MHDFAVALALVLVIEGLLWSAWPETMRRAALRAASLEPALLRRVGLGAAVVGVLGVWLVRG
jgi:uncharacterized protein YjeT (DUF2065 family)